MNTKFDSRRLNKTAYTQIDTHVDSFSFIRDVQSDLLYGDITAVKAPWISIIVPTFQRRDLLVTALNSVLKQEETDFSWECIVVDNTPLDAKGRTPALDVVEELNDRRILYYHNQQNIGTGYNWNRGVELSRGEWVSFLHDDDILHADALRNLQRIIRVNAKGKRPLGYIHARQDEFSCDDDLATLEHRDVAYFEQLTRFRSLMLGGSGTGMPSCGTAVLKRAYMEFGGINYDFGLTADAVLGYQIMEKYRVVVSDRSLGAYRWSANETLRTSSLLGLVHSDYLFAKYRYSLSVFARIWGAIFWRAEFNENIGYKIKTGKRKDILLSPDAFDFIVPYRKCNPIMRIAYKGLRKIYFTLTTVIAMIRYCVKRLDR